MDVVGQRLGLARNLVPFHVFVSYIEGMQFMEDCRRWKNSSSSF